MHRAHSVMGLTSNNTNLQLCVPSFKLVTRNSLALPLASGSRQSCAIPPPLRTVQAQVQWWGVTICETGDLHDRWYVLAFPVSLVWEKGMSGEGQGHSLQICSVLLRLLPRVDANLRQTGVWLT